MADRRRYDDDWIFDPTLAALNREMQRELREEAEEIEEIVHASEIRERHMADVAREYRNQGRLVSIATPFRDFNGYITYAAGDFLTLQSQDIEVDISLPHVAFFKINPTTRSRGGLPGTDGPGTFEMRMVERVSPYQKIEVGFATRSDSLHGKLTGTGQDHIIVTDETRNEWIVPYTTIAYVARGGPRRRR